MRVAKMRGTFVRFHLHVCANRVLSYIRAVAMCYLTNGEYHIPGNTGGRGTIVGFACLSVWTLKGGNGGYGCA